MAVEQFVDVTYRGMELGKRLRLSAFGPTSAYLEFPTPMPVGADVEITTDAGFAIAAKVVRVFEQVAGAENPPGMRLRVGDLTGEAEAWWVSKVSVDDPLIPTPPQTVQPEPEPAPAPEPEPEPDSGEDVDLGDDDADVGDDDADSVPADIPAMLQRRSARGAGGRSTMMMSTDEIRAAIEAGGQQAVLDDNGSDDADDADDGEDFGDVDAAIEDKSSAAGKKKRRRKKRKTKH